MNEDRCHDAPWETDILAIADAARRLGWVIGIPFDAETVRHLILGEADTVARIGACVDALAGVRNPVAVRELVAAARRLTEDCSGGEAAEALTSLQRAVSGLDRDPEC